jgi:hypothetical protein
VVTLKCAPEGHDFVSIVLIDLDEKLFSFGHKDQMQQNMQRILQHDSSYKIVHINEEWITATYKTVDSVGSSVFVLNRVNGEYFRVGIANYCTDSSCSQTKVSTSKSKGLCKSGLF